MKSCVMKQKWTAIGLTIVLVSLLLSRWPSAVMGQGISPPDEDAMELARTAGSRFIETAIESHPEWEDARLVEGKALYDLEDHVIAYLFALKKNGQAIGRIVVGSSAYNYDVLEAGTSLPPKLPNEQKTSDILPRELENAEPKLIYLRYDKFLAFYDTNSGRIILDPQTGNTIKATDIQSQMVSPEEYQRQQEERLRGLPTKGVNVILQYYLNGVANRLQMTSTDCGPTAAANIVHYYKINGYWEFDNWPTDRNHLYNYMHTDTWGGPGTAPWNAGPGFVAYAVSKGHHNFGSYYRIASSGQYLEIQDRLWAGRPLMIMFGWGGSYWTWHYCTIVGYRDLTYVGGGRQIYIHNPWNTAQDYVNYDTQIGVSTIHVIYSH